MRQFSGQGDIRRCHWHLTHQGGPPGQWLLAERFGPLRLLMSDHCRAEPSCRGAGHGSHGPALLLELRAGGCRAWVCTGLSQARHSWACQRSDRARDLLTLVLDNYPALRRHLDFPRPFFRRRKAHRGLEYLYHFCAAVVPGVRERPELGTGLALAWPEACCLGDSKFWQIKIFARGDGKIAAAAWKETSELRYHLKAFNEFWKQPLTLARKPRRVPPLDWLGRCA